MYLINSHLGTRQPIQLFCTDDLASLCAICINMNKRCMKYFLDQIFGQNCPSVKGLFLFNLLEVFVYRTLHPSSQAKVGDYMCTNQNISHCVEVP